MDATEAVASATLNNISRVSGSVAGAGAFRLFHMPLVRSGTRPSERELLGQAQVERVDVNGKSAVTYRWGSGEKPVLLVHGWQSRGSRFADFVPGLLERGHSVVAFDAPGHGDSTGRSTTILEYRTIISQLHAQYGTFDALVAHSMGVVGSFYAMTHGVRARTVVTISGVCDFDYLVNEFCSALKLRDQLKAQLLCQIGKNLFPDAPADRMPFSVVHATEEVQAPLLVIHDEDDTRIGVAQGRRLAAAFGPRARLITTSGLGHRRILTDGEVVRHVLDFVKHGAALPAEAEPANQPAVAE